MSFVAVGEVGSAEGVPRYGSGRRLPLEVGSDTLKEAVTPESPEHREGAEADNNTAASPRLGKPVFGPTPLSGVTHISPGYTSLLLSVYEQHRCPVAPSAEGVPVEERL